MPPKMPPKELPIRIKKELQEVPMSDLLSFTRRQRGENPEPPEFEWGGGTEQVARTRRERGNLNPSPETRIKRSPSESSDMEFPDIPKSAEKRKDATTDYERRGRSHKRAKSAALNAPRLEAPPSVRPVGEPSKGALADGSESDDDQPGRISPPPEVNWASKARQAPSPETLPSVMSTNPVQQQRVLGTASHGFAQTASVGSNIPSSGRNQLPPDHPLMVHLAALQRERQNRKFQWAGIINSMGNEFRNPASYDHQLWLMEEQKADEAIVDTMLQIRMAERGLDAGMEDVPAVEQAGTGAVRGGGQHGRGRGGHRKRNKRARNRLDNHGEKPRKIPLHMQDPFSGGVHVNFRGRKENAPSKEPMGWTPETKEDAVQTWLKDMGMSQPVPASVTGGSAIVSGGRKEHLISDRLPAPQVTREEPASAAADDREKSFISLGSDLMTDDDGHGSKDYDGFLSTLEGRSQSHTLAPLNGSGSSYTIGAEQSYRDEGAEVAQRYADRIEAVKKAAKMVEVAKELEKTEKSGKGQRIEREEDNEEAEAITVREVDMLHVKREVPWEDSFKPQEIKWEYTFLKKQVDEADEFGIIRPVWKDVETWKFDPDDLYLIDPAYDAAPIAKRIAAEEGDQRVKLIRMVEDKDEFGRPRQVWTELNWRDGCDLSGNIQPGVMYTPDDAAVQGATIIGAEQEDAMDVEQPAVKAESVEEDDLRAVQKGDTNPDTYEASEMDVEYEGYTHLDEDDETDAGSGAGAGGVSLSGVETLDLS
ncbi:MAG: hypothetical protein M1816_006991 [Peltula sp. TS41687]|nr:MAG: hypothetical protein M1816_006991 [Peltula sp. TS41687]